MSDSEEDNVWSRRRKRRMEIDDDVMLMKRPKPKATKKAKGSSANKKKGDISSSSDSDDSDTADSVLEVAATRKSSTVAGKKKRAAQRAKELELPSEDEDDNKSDLDVDESKIMSHPSIAKINKVKEKLNEKISKVTAPIVSVSTPPLESMEDDEDEAEKTQTKKPTYETAESMFVRYAGSQDAGNDIDSDGELPAGIKVVFQLKLGEGKSQVEIAMEPDQPFVEVFAEVGQKLKLRGKQVYFMFDGDVLKPSQTPSDEGMEDGDIVDVQLAAR